MRQVILDTETTGLEPEQGHRIIEIGCVEMFNRRKTGRTFHRYLRPDREVDRGALQVHGITNDFLAQQPRFADVVDELLDFIRDAELIIHNAAFDLAFLDAELKRLGAPQRRVRELCGNVLDTLPLARKMHPGQRNSLDALCKRYGVDNSRRELHGALLDAQILMDVYLAMTGGQGTLVLTEASLERAPADGESSFVARVRGSLCVVLASAEELAAHEQILGLIDAVSRGKTLWRKQEAVAALLIEAPTEPILLSETPSATSGSPQLAAVASLP